MTSENRVKRLTVDDIEVPEEMLEADHKVWETSTVNCGIRSWNREEMRSRYAAALLWLSENPIVPSLDDHDKFWAEWHADLDRRENYSAAFTREWQRIMFLKKQDALPDEVKKLLYDIGDESNKRIISAYEIGKEGK